MLRVVSPDHDIFPSDEQGSTLFIEKLTLADDATETLKLKNLADEGGPQTISLVIKAYVPTNGVGVTAAQQRALDGLHKMEGK